MDWSLFFLLGADFPPPIGFIWLIILIIFLDIIQYFYLDKYFLQYIGINKKFRLFVLNLLFYLFGGLIVSFFTSIIFITRIGLINIIIWMFVVTSVSVIYGIIFWVFNSLLYQKLFPLSSMF